MSAVESYIYQLNGEQGEVMRYLHHLLTIDFQLKAKIRYKIPFYFGRSWVCYLNPRPTGAIELAFLNGKELASSCEILISKGRKMVYGVEFKKIADIPRKKVFETIQLALLLDEQASYSKKKKNDQ
jgi:hypothetical protein